MSSGLGQIFSNSVKMTIRDKPASFLKPGDTIEWSNSQTAPTKMFCKNIPVLDVSTKNASIKTVVGGFYLLMFHANINVIDQSAGRVMFDILVNNKPVARAGVVTPYTGCYSVNWTDAVQLSPDSTITVRLTDDSNGVQIPDSTVEPGSPPFEIVGLTIIH